MFRFAMLDLRSVRLRFLPEFAHGVAEREQTVAGMRWGRWRRVVVIVTILGGTLL